MTFGDLEHVCFNQRQMRNWASIYFAAVENLIILLSFDKQKANSCCQNTELLRLHSVRAQVFSKTTMTKMYITFEESWKSRNIALNHLLAAHMKGHVFITSRSWEHDSKKAIFHICDSSISFAFMHTSHILISSKSLHCLYHNRVSTILR